MRPSFRLGTAAVSLPADQSPSSSSSGRSEDVVCELSPLQSPLAPPSAPVEERLLHYGHLYDERRRHALEVKRQHDEAALAALTQPPPPSQRGCRFEPTPSLHASAEVSRQHRADRVSKYVTAAAAQQTGRPRILPTSRDMAAAVRQRERWEGLPVGDILLARQRAHEQRIAEKRAEAAAALTFHPSVSAHTKQLKTAAPVVERLYTSAQTAAKQRAALADVTNRHEAAAKLPSTACAATYHRLYHDAVTRKAQSETLEKVEQVRSRSGFHPRLNPVSEMIAAQSDESTQARLLRPKGPADAARRHVDPEETFAPRTNATAARFSEAPVTQRSAMWLRRREDRLQRVAAERQEAEMRECTFRPHTNRGPVTASPWTGEEMAEEGEEEEMDDAESDLVASAEALLSRIDAPLDDGCMAAEAPACWADVLRSSVPDDVLDILKEAEAMSRHTRRSLTL